MRTVGALRDAQRLNRRERRQRVRELLRQPRMDIGTANRIAGEEFDQQWDRLERQAELNKVPGNRR